MITGRTKIWPHEDYPCHAEQDDRYLDEPAFGFDRREIANPASVQIVFLLRGNEPLTGVDDEGVPCYHARHGQAHAEVEECLFDSCHFSLD